MKNPCFIFCVLSVAFPLAIQAAPVSNASQSSPASGAFINLGPQVTATVLQGSEFLHDPAGRDLIYTVERGQPAHLLAYDVASGQKITDVPMPADCDGAWEVTASSDGLLYTASGYGHMFCHHPGATTIEDLGPLPTAEKVVWDVCAGDNGEIFGATYPGCRVVGYKPGAGFTDIGHGPLVEGENYVRCVVYDPRSKKIYAGVGSHAHLIELDPRTGAKRELLAHETTGQEAVYSLQIVPDKKSGDRLFAWITNRNQTLVYNLRTQAIERSLPSGPVKAVKKSPDEEKVYYCDDDRLASFDLDKPAEPPRTLVRCSGMLASQWLDTNHLCVLTRYDQLLTYDIRGGAVRTTTLKIPPQPILVQTIALGPDGKMWMGGFLGGGTTAFDPATGRSAEYHGLSQIERIGVLGGQMYLGVYPHGRLYQFNPAQPWSPNNPRKFAQIEGQSRPITILGVPELQKVYIGTVPEYGILGGHFIGYDPKTNDLRDYGQMIARQSVVSLVYAHGMIIGGSAITGGLGIKPTETDAKLFCWDPISAKKISELTPVPGAIAITSLMVGPGKNVWGIADGTLFIFDPIQGKILRRHHLLEVDYDSRNIWRDAFMITHPSGQIYAAIDGRLVRLDPQTEKMTILRNKNVSLLAMDRNGRLYFRDTSNLWQYVP